MQEAPSRATAATMRETETWTGTARETEIVTGREITPTYGDATAALVATSMVAGNTEATTTLEVGVVGMGMFVLGGVAFTAGGYIFATERPNPVPGKFGFHEIWHVAVILGAAFHYAVMYFYVLMWEG